MSVIHTFSSTSGSGLCAFTDDAEGRKLPERHGPWKHTDRVPSSRDLPHGIDRGAVETAIELHGYQMWRPRKTAG
ncbi:MAG: hypothetical protein OEL76_14170 [Siculibacillus sp.]|nr:hypothetical protein [Siculibacillus sp.]